MNLVYIYFWRAEKNMGELRDAAFASFWGRAAIETKQIWTWVCSCSIIYCVDCFILSLVEGREYLLFFFFFLEFCILFLLSFLFRFLIFSTVVCPSLSWYWKCFWNVLYFHSCGIVGIMMVVIKPAHLCFAVYGSVCRMWAFARHSEKRRTPCEVTRMLRSLLIEHLGCSLLKKKRKKKGPLNITACRALMVLQNVKNSPSLGLSTIGIFPLLDGK